MQSGHLVKITAFLPADATSPSDMADATALVAELKRELEGRGFADVTLVSRFGMRRRDKPIDLVAMADSARATADALAALQAANPDEAECPAKDGWVAGHVYSRQMDQPYPRLCVKCGTPEKRLSQRHRSMIVDEDMRRSEAAIAKANADMDRALNIPSARHQSMIMDEDMRRSEAAAPLPPEERDDPYAIPAALDRRTKAAE